MEKDNLITALKAQNSTLDNHVDKLENTLEELKKSASDAQSLQATNEGYTRKVETLELELDEADKNLKSTTAMLRETDIRGEQLERKVASLEAEKEEAENKYEALLHKYNDARAELDEISQQLEAI